MNINKEKLLKAYKAVQGWVVISCVIGVALMAISATFTIDMVVKNTVIGSIITAILAYTGIDMKIAEKIVQAKDFIVKKFS